MQIDVVGLEVKVGDFFLRGHLARHACICMCVVLSVVVAAA